MARYGIWYDGKKAGGKYSVVDASSREPVFGEDGRPLTDLSFNQALEQIEKLTSEDKSRTR